MGWRGAARAGLAAVTIASTLIIGGAATASAADGPLAAECVLSGRYGSSGVNVGQSVGVGFTSTATGPLESVRARVGQFFQVPQAPALTVRVTERSGTTPGAVLASTSVAAAELPQGWLDFPLSEIVFDDAPVLTAGQQYAVTFESGAQPHEGTYSVELMAQSGCPDDLGLVRRGGTWTADSWTHPIEVRVAAPAPVTASECGPPHPGNSYASVTTNQSVSAVFTSESTRQLSAVDLAITNSDANGDLRVALHEVDSGKPADVLAIAAVSPGELPLWNDFRMTTVAFDAPAALEAGHTYAIVLSSDVGGSGWMDIAHFRWAIAANTTGCPGVTTMYRAASLGTLEWTEVGTSDVVFALPTAPKPDADTDGIPDDADPDDDNDGTPDTDDAFPLDPTEQTDADNDGTGDNADTDDDNDGTPDTDDAFPLDPTRDGDEDDDGIRDTPPPASKDECRGNGWQAFNNPSFRNAGQCTSHVATGGRKH